jgi:hypothetical protein
MRYRKLIALLFVVCSVIVPHWVNAAGYPIAKVTHVYTDVYGKLSIKRDSAPSPGPCGTNYGWVVVEATADNALKSFVYSLYVSGMPATVVTEGCSGNAQKVIGIYSPGG